MAPSPNFRPSDWKHALAELVAARIQLFSLEAQDVGKLVATRAALAAVAAFCSAIFWLCLIAGGIGWISTVIDWPWYHVTLLAAALHLLVVVIAVVLIKRPAAKEGFPLTRSEFEKDRAWLQSLKHQPKPRF